MTSLLIDDLLALRKKQVRQLAQSMPLQFYIRSKLFEATTDPELKKLVALFEWLVPPQEL